MATVPKLARNREITRAMILGTSLRKLEGKYSITRPAIRSAVQTALRYDAPDFVGLNVEQLRERKNDVLPLLDNVIHPGLPA